MPNDFNASVIAEFRASNGRVGGMFEGARLLLLTTTGARSGNRHTVPLGYLPDGERVLVIGSNGGSRRHPAWYHNLLAKPVATVEDGVFVYEAAAVMLAGRERDDAFARAVEQDAGWAGYERQSGRVLPVVALEALPMSGPPRSGAGSPGEMLRLVHDAFRRELSLIRAEVAGSGAVLGAQLRVNCLSLCAGLHGHHVREDQGMFPGLEYAYPQLAPVIERLRAEHVAVAALVERLRSVVSDPAVERGALIAEVGVLAGELEKHLEYEERELIPALDGML
ncbi:cation-binding protein [Actinoplanes italicus]|uniref:Deazaflavin-dependent oxidoreductase (Nitroreductase family) n=1 Tax=Actinoplanes italicus TaxID=113567 RepID=A0A2T0KH61_9ACTN|nr:nitroreductase/quinone reductase family protein [Actinoplanes italicus]PRX22775.1 deazaflavin-dependent oxidoreductase (nitroreductase family) [Actinoplanes italicus]GIE28298.1 cation-binding protein [Actinoplanes italicus]